MITRVGMAPRAAGMAPEEFQLHWRTAHAAAAGAIPGVRRYVQDHAVLVDGVPLLPHPGFDACSELDFDDLAAHDAAFASSHYQGPVREDEDRFVDRSRGSSVLTSRELRIERGGAPADPVRLLSMWRAHPVRGLVALADGAERWAARVAEDRRVVRHERLAVLHEVHAERQPAPCDLVDVLVFDGLDDARAHLAGPAHEAADALAGRTFGAVHLVARPVVVTGEASGSRR